MTTQVLEYLIAIEEERSLTRAAERFYLSQPSLSYHLAKAEQELKVKLFQKKGRSLQPTEEGLSDYREDAAQRLSDYREDAALQVERLKTETLQKMGQAQTAGNDRFSALLSRGQELLEKHRSFTSQLSRGRRNLLLRNPTAASGRFGEALKELSEQAKKQRRQNRR